MKREESLQLVQKNIELMQQLEDLYRNHGMLTPTKSWGGQIQLHCTKEAFEEMRIALGVEEFISEKNSIGDLEYYFTIRYKEDNVKIFCLVDIKEDYYDR